MVDYNSKDIKPKQQDLLVNIKPSNKYVQAIKHPFATPKRRRLSILSLATVATAAVSLLLVFVILPAINTRDYTAPSGTGDVLSDEQFNQTLTEDNTNVISDLQLGKTDINQATDLLNEKIDSFKGAEGQDTARSRAYRIALATTYVTYGSVEHAINEILLPLYQTSTDPYEQWQLEAKLAWAYGEAHDRDEQAKYEQLMQEHSAYEPGGFGANAEDGNE